MKKEINYSRVLIISMFLVSAIGLMYLNGSLTGLAIGEENETQVNQTIINETMENSTINQTVNQTINQTEINETTFNDSNNNLTINQTNNQTEINETDSDEEIIVNKIKLIYDISSLNFIEENITTTTKYCSLKNLNCDSLALFEKEDCGNKGFCNFNNLDGSSFGFYDCNTPLNFSQNMDIAKLAICAGEEALEAEENSIFAYKAVYEDGSNYAKEAHEFCKALGLKCKAVERFYRADCANEGWCGFEDLTGSSIKLYGCGRLNNFQKIDSAQIILCAGKQKAENLKCEDSDGMDYLTKGFTTKNNNNKTDSCEGDILSEYFCEDKNLMRSLVNCSYGCEDGACLPYVPVCTDLDEDGFSIEGGECGRLDCNDNNFSINPNMTESCNDISGYDGIDNDCDGTIDLDCEAHCDLDGDGFSITSKFYCAFIGKGLGECNEGRADIFPGADDSDCDGWDNDCDGIIDNNCILNSSNDTQISEPEIIEEEIIITQYSPSSGGGGGGGGSYQSGGQSIQSPYLVNEEDIQAQELSLNSVRDEQTLNKSKFWYYWFSGLFSIAILLVIYEIYRAVKEREQIDKKIRKKK